MRCSARYVSPCRIYFICQKWSRIYFSVEFSLREISFARANDAEIVRSRDAQCHTEESPQKK